MSLHKWFKNRRCSNADSNDLECQKQLKCHNLLTISLTCIQFALAAMSIGYVSLAAIESGEYSAPAEQASLFVANGPWPTGRKSFYRKKNESVEAWCAKVLLSARDTRSAVRFLLRHPRLPLDRLSIGSCVCAGNASRAACAPPRRIFGVHGRSLPAARPGLGPKVLVQAFRPGPASKNTSVMPQFDSGGLKPVDSRGQRPASGGPSAPGRATQSQPGGRRAARAAP